jgi:hypothetical protein
VVVARLVQRYAHLSATHKAEAVERIAGDHFTIGFTTLTRGDLAVSDKLLKAKAPP